MTNRTINHEIKLQKSVIVNLGIFAVGVCGIAFSPVFTVSDAVADHGFNAHNGLTSRTPIYFGCVKGCN
jgi:hypothetical protein